MNDIQIESHVNMFPFIFMLSKLSMQMEIRRILSSLSFLFLKSNRIEALRGKLLHFSHLHNCVYKKKYGHCVNFAERRKEKSTQNM